MAAILAACSQSHSSLSPAGPDAHQIANLIWIFIIVCGVIWVAVMIVLVLAIARRRGERPDPLETSEASERQKGTIIAACVAGTAGVVIALTIVSYFSQQKLFAGQPTDLNLQVTGHQWWWEVRYQDPSPSRQFVTANEIHIPVGASVGILLNTADVIHSFWVPSLAGKMDQITGQNNELRLAASRAGIYRGQCAEFCGQEHAKMALFVIASAREEFEAWREAQLQSAAMPLDPVRQAGLQAFFERGCMLCHTIQGTNAGGKVGPDLTHVGSRRTIAAGTLPNTPGNLGGWIADPQHVKPGTKMPPIPLEGTQLTSLVAYLTGLK